MQQFMKAQYAGFKLNETLASNLRFSGLVRIRDIQRRTLHLSDDEIPYWSISDEFGAKFSCFDENLCNKLQIMERYEFKGFIRIGKGGTYLNLTSATVFSGNSYSLA